MRGKYKTIQQTPYLDNKRYYTLDSYFKKIFNKKVIKIALDIGATCPNLDGTLETTTANGMRTLVVILTRSL